MNISQLNEIGKNTLAECLEMEVTEIGENFLTMRMPVTNRVHQPMGLLHGGAVAALAENVASLAANIVAGKDKACLGLSLNTNHIKSVASGFVYATAIPVHIGRSTHVWKVETRNEMQELINTTTMTMAVINKV